MLMISKQSCAQKKKKLNKKNFNKTNKLTLTLNNNIGTRSFKITK